MFSSLPSHRPLNTHLFVQFSSCSVQFVTHAHDDATLSMGGSPYVRTAYRTHNVSLHSKSKQHISVRVSHKSSEHLPSCTPLCAAPPLFLDDGHAEVLASELAAALVHSLRTSAMNLARHFRKRRRARALELPFQRRPHRRALTPPTRLPLLRRARA